MHPLLESWNYIFTPIYNDHLDFFLGAKSRRAGITPPPPLRKCMAQSVKPTKSIILDTNKKLCTNANLYMYNYKYEGSLLYTDSALTLHSPI